MRARSIDKVFFIIVLIYMIGCSAAAFFFPGAASTAAGSVLIAQALILGGTLWGCRKLRVRPLSHMRFCTVRSSVLLCSAACTAALYPILTVISAVMRLFFKSGTGTISASLTEGNLFLNLLIYALIPAVVEEMMQRGLLYCGYRKACGVRTAVPLSALLFGCFHMNLDQLAYTFVFGIFLCLVMEVSDSIWACITSHFTLNAISVAASYAAGILSLDASAETALTVTPALCILLLVCAAAAVFFFRLLLRCGGKADSFPQLFSVQKTAAQAGRRQLPSVELILGIGLCVLYMAAYELIM